MFFDDVHEKQEDTEYEQIMRAIAGKQRQLLECSFNWQGRSRKKTAPKTFFGNQRKAQNQSDMLKMELDKLKQQAEVCRERHGFSHGLFWWQLPWEQVEAALLYDLEDINVNGNWRFEYQWRTAEKSGMQLLFLIEEGHCNQFFTDSHYEIAIDSPYSSAEINEKMQQFNTNMTVLDLASVGGVSGPVHSVLTGADYRDGMDYLLSAENIMVRSQLSDSYARNLYTQHEVTTVYASSQSIHYKNAYLVGEYHCDIRNRLDYVKTVPYTVCQSEGNVPDEILKYYSERDLQVGMAAYLVDRKDIGAVSQLFEKDITKASGSFEKAMRQAKIYTCTAVATRAQKKGQI